MPLFHDLTSASSAKWRPFCTGHKVLRFLRQNQSICIISRNITHRYFPICCRPQSNTQDANARTFHIDVQGATKVHLFTKFIGDQTRIPTINQRTLIPPADQRAYKKDSILNSRVNSTALGALTGKPNIPFAVKDEKRYIPSLPDGDAKENILATGKYTPRPVVDVAFQQLSPKHRKAWIKNTNMLHKYPFDFVKNPTGICDPSTDILVLVNSRLSGQEQRAAIRDTWGNAIKQGVWLGEPLKQKVAIAFVVGVSNTPFNITQEFSTHQDIIQGNFIDHYHNMTIKSLLAMKWAVRHCDQARYFIRSDDDVIINLPHMIDMFMQKNFAQTIVGPMIKTAKPERKGRWAVSEDEYGASQYPIFAAGSAYVITMDLLRPLLTAADLYPYLSIDDMYITGILAEHVLATHFDPKGFSFSGTKLPTACDFVNGTRLSGHGFKPDVMRTFWESVADAAC